MAGVRVVDGDRADPLRAVVVVADVVPAESGLVDHRRVGDAAPGVGEVGGSDQGRRRAARPGGHLAGEHLNIAAEAGHEHVGPRRRIAVGGLDARDRTGDRARATGQVAAAGAGRVRGLPAAALPLGALVPRAAVAVVRLARELELGVAELRLGDFANPLDRRRVVTAGVIRQARDAHDILRHVRKPVVAERLGNRVLGGGRVEQVGKRDRDLVFRPLDGLLDLAAADLRG